MKRFLLLSLIIIGTSHFFSACAVYSNGIYQELEIGLPVKVNASIGDARDIVPFKEDWIGKVNVDKLSQNLSPGGEWVLIDTPGSEKQYFLMSTVPPYKTFSIPADANAASDYLFWSPDEKSFAVLGSSDPDLKFAVFDRVILYNFEDGKVLNSKEFILPFSFFEGNGLLSISWAPDSSQLSIIEEGTNKIYIIDKDGQLQSEINLWPSSGKTDVNLM